MTVLRWTVGVVAALLGLAPMLGFLISVVFENEVWRQRTRRFRAWLGVVALAWFNGGVWGPGGASSTRCSIGRAKGGDMAS